MEHYHRDKEIFLQINLKVGLKLRVDLECFEIEARILI